MKVAVWKTGHAIADTVADAVFDGLAKEHKASSGKTISLIKEQFTPISAGIGDYDLHIGYGILRSMDGVMKHCQDVGKPFIQLDRGYFKPNHFDGFYRVSLNGTQQTDNLGELPVNVRRWEKLGLTIEKPRPEWKPYDERYTLVVPPSDYVKQWLCLNWQPPLTSGDRFIRWRMKGDATPLDVDLDACGRVITFNSSVGWEALRRGIPVISDPTHSIVGAWEKMLDGRATLMDTREHLFSVMSGLEMTLDEIRAGKLMPLIEQLLHARAA